MTECREADMHRGVASPASVRSEASLELAMPRIEVRLTLCRLGVECEIAIGEGVAEPRTVASAAELVAQAAKRPIDRPIRLSVVLLQDLLPRPRRLLDERGHIGGKRILRHRLDAAGGSPKSTAADQSKSCRSQFPTMGIVPSRPIFEA